MKKLLLLCILLTLSLHAKPQISVSIAPQVYFVKAIAGQSVDINLLVKPGASPASYEPKPKQMKELESSDIYFAIGVPYERVWLKKFAQMFPKLSIIKTQNGIEKKPILGHSHSHKAHKHHILDPHIWLDPVLVKIQAKNIADALIDKYPENKALYEKNLKAFLQSLDALDAQISKLLQNKKSKKFLVFHPSWGYFVSRYGIVQKAIEIEGKEPKPRDLQHIIHEAKEDNIGIVFVAPQFSQKSAQTIAKQINAKVISINPLSFDWENELVKNAKLLSEHLR